MSAPKKVLLCNELKHRLDQRDPERDLSGKHYESARQENYLLCVYPDFSFGNQSCHSFPWVISLHDWFI